jgi:hypothetical protein
MAQTRTPNKSKNPPIGPKMIPILMPPPLPLLPPGMTAVGLKVTNVLVIKCLIEETVSTVPLLYVESSIDTIVVVSVI